MQRFSRQGTTLIKCVLARSNSTAPKAAGRSSWFSSKSVPMEVSASEQSDTAKRRSPPTMLAEQEPQSPASEFTPTSSLVVKKTKELNIVEQFFEEARAQELKKQLEENAEIAMPTHPDEIVPEFRRIKRHTKQMIIITDPDYPTYERKDYFVPLPPPKKHPWADAVMGPHITHGDGQLGVVGTGEVGFDKDHPTAKLPQSWRGLQHKSVVGRALPDHNGRVLDGETVVRHSLSLTGRGVFAQRDIKAGEVIMVVTSTAQCLGLTGESRRLIDMCVDILKQAHEGRDEDRNFLHDWILNGQMSSFVERWPQKHTDEVITKIGGRHVLDELELHPVHIARLAAIIDMNSFVIESAYNERRGMGYWPEAGYFNHSCAPNSTYEIVPEHVFKESEFYVDESVRREEEGDGVDDVAMSAASDATSTSPRPQGTDAAATNPTQNDSDQRTEGNCGCTGDEKKCSEVPPSGSAVQKVAKAEDKLMFGDLNLTAGGAPAHLFCMRAVKDIKANEEILISYVPTEWTFDGRQYVLLDRYRFRCKCPRCAPTLDSKYARLPRFIMLAMAFLLTAQIAIIKAKNTLAENLDVDGELPRNSFVMNIPLLGTVIRASHNTQREKLYDMDYSKGKEALYGSDPYTKGAR